MLLFIFFSLFSVSCLTHNDKIIVPENEKIVNKQLAYSEKMLREKYNIRPRAVTVAMPEGDIQYLELKFNIQGPLSKAEIRRILIDVIHDFLSNINNDKELCAYLKKGSLSISEVGITLFLRDSNCRPISQPNIGVAFIERGVLTFVTLEHEAIPSFRDHIDETYEEALQILQSQRECAVVQKWCNDLAIQ